MQLFAALPASSKETPLKKERKSYYGVVKNNPKMLLLPRHSDSKQNGFKEKRNLELASGHNDSTSPPQQIYPG